MTKPSIKTPTTKLAKQLSGYLILNYDMQFAARVFALAASRAARSPSEQQSGRLSVKDRMEVLQAADSILRAGAMVGILDEDGRNESESEKCALFEAGIVTYCRCFNSGLRTGLSKREFKGRFSRLKGTHKSIVDIRNKHVAHATLKMERSIIGIQLVDDQNYGPRPNMVLTALTMKRHYPSDDRLIELAEHCGTIAKKIIDPRILKTSRALREQLLKMPAEQIDDFPDFGVTTPEIEKIF